MPDHSLVKVQWDVMQYARALLVALVLWLLYRSFHPFVFVNSLPEYFDELWGGVLEPIATQGMLKHVIAMLMCGALLALSQDRGRSELLRVVVLLAIASVAVEVAQAAVPRRHCRLGDVFLHVGSGATGAWVAIILANSGAGLLQLRRLLKVSTVGVLAALALLLPALISMSLPITSSLHGWSEDYPLLLGNERSGDRPWSGRIREVSIYPTALSADQIETLSQGSSDSDHGRSLRELHGAIFFASFNGAEGKVFPIDGSKAEQFPWRVNASGVLECEASTDRIVSIIRETGSFSFEVRCAPSDLLRDGPARIVSISRNASLRNVTLGQDADRLVLRVRTPINGRNGARFPGIWSNVFVDHADRHIVVTYDHGVMRAFVDGRELHPHQALDTVGAVIGVRPGWEAPVTAILVFLPLGTLIGARRQVAGTKSRLTVALCAALIPTAVAMVTAFVVFQHWTDPILLVAAVPALVCGVFLARRMSGHPFDPKPSVWGDSR